MANSDLIDALERRIQAFLEPVPNESSFPEWGEEGGRQNDKTLASNHRDLVSSANKLMRQIAGEPSGSGSQRPVEIARLAIIAGFLNPSFYRGALNSVLMNSSGRGYRFLAFAAALLRANPSIEDGALTEKLRAAIEPCRSETIVLGGRITIADALEALFSGISRIKELGLIEYRDGSKYPLREWYADLASSEIAGQLVFDQDSIVHLGVIAASLEAPAAQPAM